MRPKGDPNSPFREAMQLMGETVPDVASLTGLFVQTLKKLGRGKRTMCSTVCLAAAALECPLGPLIAYQLPDANRPQISHMAPPLPRRLPTAWDQIDAARRAQGIAYDDLPASTATSAKIQRGEDVLVATMAKYATGLGLDLTRLVAAHGLPAVVERGL